MSLINKTLIIILGLVGVYLISTQVKLQKNTAEILGAIKRENESVSLKEIDYQELSPDRSKDIISYYMIYDPRLYHGYYEDYSANHSIIAVKDMERGTEDYIFTDGRIGFPKWLGNEHVFFSSYCGTSCQGLYLVNTLNKEVRLAVLSYMVIDPKRPSYTHFRDWFGKEFEFNGLVDNITSETVKDKVYLIFQMKNDEGKPAGQKRFLFTGKALEE